jgi:hypothetical protein
MLNGQHRVAGWAIYHSPELEAIAGSITVLVAFSVGPCFANSPGADGEDETCCKMSGGIPAVRSAAGRGVNKWEERSK